MLTEVDRQLEDLFEQYDRVQSRDTLSTIRGVLNRRKYIQNLVDEVRKSLAPSP
jgi:hypothetical protein